MHCAHVGKHGVVRDKNVHAQVVKRILNFAVEVGFGVAGLTFTVDGTTGEIAAIVNSAHETLDAWKIFITHCAFRIEQELN